jgi:hypothetical protein
MMSTKELPGNSSFLSFFGVLSVVPVTIQLPDLDSQTEFNLARWEQVLADTTLATLSYRIETDQHGHILMSPPPAPLHGQRQIQIGVLFHQLLPAGRIVSECPLSTAGGVKAIDVAWLAPGRPENISQLILFERAPEICVEIVSPSNSRSETPRCVPYTSMPAQSRSGFVRWKVLSPFLPLLTNSYLLLQFARPFLSGSCNPFLGIRVTLPFANRQKLPFFRVL